MFWIHYPSARELLSNHIVRSASNDATRITWDNIFEMRKFSSYVYKESNVYDRRIKDYKSGIDILKESRKVTDKILNYESDLWTN